MINGKKLSRILREGVPMQCNCDLDKWEPEPNTGHSCVCRIHKLTQRLLDSIDEDERRKAFIADKDKVNGMLGLKGNKRAEDSEIAFASELIDEQWADYEKAKGENK